MKRGMSGIITSVIIIGIALAAIGIVWFVINTVVSEQTSQVENKSSKVFQSCKDVGYYKVEGEDSCVGSVKYFGGEKCCDGLLNSLYGLVSYWSFDVDARDDWGDNEGTVTGATWNSTGGFNGKGAYEFDGSGDYIDLSSNISFDKDDNWSASWFMQICTECQPRVFGQNGTTYNSLLYNNNASGLGNYYVRLTSEEGVETTFNDFPYLNESTWYHVAMVFEGGTDKTYAYFNGQPIQTATSVFNSSVNFNLIGAFNTKVSYSFDGTLDEIRIYNRTLSEQEVGVLYNFN